MIKLIRHWQQQLYNSRFGCIQHAATSLHLHLQAMTLEAAMYYTAQTQAQLKYQSFVAEITANFCMQFILQHAAHCAQYGWHTWSGFLSADSVGTVNSLLKRAFKYGYTVLTPDTHLRHSVMTLMNVFLERYIMNITVSMISYHHYHPTT